MAAIRLGVAPQLQVPEYDSIFESTLSFTSNGASLYFGYVDESMIQQKLAKRALEEAKGLLDTESKMCLLREQILPNLPPDSPWGLSEYSIVSGITRDYLKEHKLLDRLDKLGLLRFEAVMREIFISMEAEAKAARDLWRLRLLNETDLKENIHFQEILLALNVEIEAASRVKLMLLNPRLVKRLVDWSLALFKLITMMNVRIYQIILLLKEQKTKDAYEKIDFLRSERTDIKLFLDYSREDKGLTTFDRCSHG